MSHLRIHREGVDDDSRGRRAVRVCEVDARVVQLSTVQPGDVVEAARLPRVPAGAPRVVGQLPHVDPLRAGLRGQEPNRRRGRPAGCTRTAWSGRAQDPTTLDGQGPNNRPAPGYVGWRRAE
eukprot:gene14668-biopygen4050